MKKVIAMQETTKKMLFEKNSRIIEAVRVRADRMCPGALDMIAVTGSFASGDYHEKSDLDLLIVISDDAGYALSHCFVLDDVGYDLYCHTWQMLEDAAAYQSPFVSKLLDAQIVYCRDDAVRTRFSKIAERLKMHLSAPLTEDDCAAAAAEVRLAKEAYFDLAASDGAGYRFVLLGVMYHLTCAVYLLNHAVVRHGVRGIPSELGVLQDLPADFQELHQRACDAHAFAQAQTAAMNMICTTERWVIAHRDAVSPRQKPCKDSLRGSYEELFSNYRNKLRYAVETGDAYLSRMTLASAQMFFDEVGAEEVLAQRILFDDDDYRRCDLASAAFDRAMDRYERVYEAVGLTVCRYTDTNAFENAYAKEN